MRWPDIISKLQMGVPVTVKPRGNSMTPRIKSGQEVTIVPHPGSYEVGTVVLARVRGSVYLHEISAISGKRIQISNHHGYVNGWTTGDKIYGLVPDV